MRGWRDVVTVRLVYHGHSCFSVEGAAKIIWVEPFLTDNPQSDFRPEDIREAEYILVSHGHGDHLGDTMGPDDALRAVKLLAPRLVVPMHNNTFEVIQQDPHAFAERVKESTDANCVVLSQGQSLQI